MLHCYAASQRTDAVDIARRYRLGMVDEPMQPAQRHFAIDRFVNVEGAANGLVVSCMHTERPAVSREQRDDAFQIAFHVRRHVWTRLEKIFEVRS